MESASAPQPRPEEDKSGTRDNDHGLDGLGGAPPPSTALKISDAISLAREDAAALPGVWHEKRTRRYAVHVAWLRTEEGEDVLRIYRELLNANVEDLVAILRYMPSDVAVRRFEVENAPPSIDGGRPKRYLHLHLRPKEQRTPELAQVCTRCGRTRAGGQPLVSDEMICLYCATGATVPAG